MRAFGRVLPWLLLLLAVADWVGLKSGRLGHAPGWLAVLVGAVVGSLMLRLAIVLGSTMGGRRPRGPAIGEALLAVGVVVALLGGTANWTLGLQGFVVLNEGEAVPLHGGSHLQQFDGGPFARMDEMNVVLTLEELALRPAGSDHFYPESQLLVQRGGGPAARLSIGADSTGAAGPLRFHQGAFGFAPRIVILRDGETVFDRVVPFTTRRGGPAGIAFEGSFTIERESLAVEGSVDLASLDEGMRGHATLELAVLNEGEVIGRGKLLPGHFADLGRGYRIGFAGLEKWSEIDVSRRTYGSVVLTGAALALVGMALWPVAAWRSR